MYPGRMIHWPTPFDYLVDILSDTPYFLQQVTSDQTSATIRTRNTQQDNILLQQQLIERLEKVKMVLETWHVKYSSPLQTRPPQKPSQTISHGRSTEDTLEPPYASVLYFTDMYRAYDYIIFKTALILLMMLYECVTHDIDPSLPYPSAVLQEILPDTTLQSLAQDICRCTEYLLLPAHGSRGYIVLTFPASVAYFAIDKNCPEAKWLYDVCSRNAGGSGFGFGTSVLERVTPLSAWMHDCKERQRRAQRLLQNDIQ